MGISLKSYLKFVTNPLGVVISGAGDWLAEKKTEKNIKASQKAQDKEMAFNAEQAQLNRDYQTSERIAAQDWDEEMWNKNNEYNSASAQVQRMLQAGINPNTAFGNGYTSAEAAAPTTTPQSGGAASYSSSMASSILSALTDQNLKMAQIDNLKANTESTQINTKFIGKRATAEIAKIYSDIGINDFNKDLQERTFALFDKKTRAECDVMMETLNKLRNENLEILKNLDLKDAEIQKIFSEIALNKKQGNKLDSEIALNNKQGNKLDAETRGQNIDNAIEQIVLEFSDATGIPVGASEQQGLFYLWKEGRMQEVYDKIKINQTESDDPIKHASGMGGLALDYIGRELDKLVDGIGQIFTK